MDVVIPFIHSDNADVELLFALRSLEQHFAVSDVYLIGDKSDFVNDTVRIAGFNQEGTKDYSIAKKVEFACGIYRLSDDFLFMNDDHFFTKDIGFYFPYYHRGDLENKVKNDYNRYQNETKAMLKGLGKESKDFDVHCPIVYNKDKFLKLKDIWRKDKSYLVKSVYCNWHGIEGKIYKDCKLNRLKHQHDFERAFENECFSVHDFGLYNGVIKTLAESFKKPSRWEKEIGFELEVQKDFKDKETGDRRHKKETFLVDNDRAMELLQTEYVKLVGYGEIL